MLETKRTGCAKGQGDSVKLVQISMTHNVKVFLNQFCACSIIWDLRENHAYPPTSGPNMKFERNSHESQRTRTERIQTVLKITRSFAKKALIFALKDIFLELTRFSKKFTIITTRKTQFQGGKAAICSQNFVHKRMKDFGSIWKRNQNPFDFIQFSKTLECPKTTIFTKLKIVASKK